MTWIVALIGLVIALINIWYSMSKDAIQKGEAEIKECVETIKKALQDSIMTRDKDKIKTTYTYIESLGYLRLVKENKLKDELYKFAETINDFCENNKMSDEDLFGAYKIIIEKIYTMKISTWKYIKFVFRFQ